MALFKIMLSPQSPQNKDLDNWIIHFTENITAKKIREQVNIGCSKHA
ncbi:hypothetical protein AGMMS49921_14080 [Endomicrobiia bacterium]|nr:hypothetical protein AGMMS49921_14080 [Endomicrobiia bacterium]